MEINSLYMIFINNIYKWNRWFLEKTCKPEITKAIQRAFVQENEKRSGNRASKWNAVLPNKGLLKV